MFRSELLLEADRRPGKWIVRAPLIWACPNFGMVTVPYGIETDLASIPQMAKGIPGFDPNGLSRRPAVLHDYLYQSHDVSRLDADQLLFDALRAEGVGEPLARVYYRAVRLFGSHPWEAAGRA